MEPAIFSCSICGDDSTEICVYCTKDACGNHLCERCHRCSDCCHCDMPLTKASKDAMQAFSHSFKPHTPETTAAEQSESVPTSTVPE